MTSKSVGQRMLVRTIDGDLVVLLSHCADAGVARQFGDGRFCSVDAACLQLSVNALATATLLVFRLKVTAGLEDLLAADPGVQRRLEFPLDDNQKSRSQGREKDSPSRREGFERCYLQAPRLGGFG